MIDREHLETSASPLQEAMAYVRLAWEIVVRDAEAGVLDDADVENLEERMASAEAMLSEQLHRSSPMTHGDPLAGLTVADIQEAYYRLPFTAADAQALPWDDLIARLRAIAQRGSLAACVAYAHVTSARLCDASGADPALLHDVQAALDALRERFRAPLPEAEQAQHEEAEKALAAINAMRHEVEEIRRRRSDASERQA